MDTDYTITGQRQVIALGDNGAASAMQVDFRVNANGVAGSVTVPLADYSAATVGRMIEDMVRKINDVHALGNPEK